MKLDQTFVMILSSSKFYHYLNKLKTAEEIEKAPKKEICVKDVKNFHKIS